VSPRVLAFDDSVVAREPGGGPVLDGAAHACSIYGCSSAFATPAGDLF
jgi:hypothetical protein